jgi:hypothetical protein
MNAAILAPVVTAERQAPLAVTSNIEDLDSANRRRASNIPEAQIGGG